MILRVTSIAIVGTVLLLLLPGCGDSFGITPSNPLGTWDVMDSVLTADKGLTRTERKFQVVECFRRELFEKFGKLKVFQYEEIAQNSDSKHLVLLAVDEVNIVRAVGGIFHSGRKSFSDSGSKVEGYMASLWAEVNGAPVEFTKENEPGGMISEFLLTKINKGNVHGIWKKTPATGEIAHHRTILDRMLLWID
jgi:hypothetical protein